MRVDAVELRRIQIPMKRAFSHALHERTRTDAVLVRILDDSAGIEGWGEVVPRPYVTGETVDSVLDEHAPAMAERLLGCQFDGWDAAAAWLTSAAADVGQNLATLCGFDLALLDAVGRAVQAPVAELLGGTVRESLPAGVIVGFETATDKVARYCAALRLAGKRHVKVKVGRDDDLQRLQAVTKVFRELPIRIDANAAWTADEAIERIVAMKEVVPIASVEQPVPAADIDGLRRVRREADVLVMADESVCSLADAQILVEREAADIFNVRLGKNGGLVAANRLVDYAVEAGVQVHLGTMVGETGVLSAASETFGRCRPEFDCLDGKGQSAFLLEVDIASESGEHPGPVRAPGLGVDVDLARVTSLQVGDTKRQSKDRS
jgi:muconate cycloisomerase